MKARRQAILLDLGNSAGEVVEIRTHGWSIETGFNFFRHSRGDRALPVPQASEIRTTQTVNVRHRIRGIPSHGAIQARSRP